MRAESGWLAARLADLLSAVTRGEQVFVARVVAGVIAAARSTARGYGAMAARLTPDQKVGSSILSGLISPSVGGLLLARSQSRRGLGAMILGIEHVGLSRRGQLFAHTPA